MSAHSFHGGCHCGAVRFSVRVRELVALDCNCSVCAGKDLTHVIVPAADFALLTCDARAFDPHVQHARSTRTWRNTGSVLCALHTHFTPPRSHPGGVDVNARALDDDALQKFRAAPFDGKNREDNVDSIT